MSLNEKLEGFTTGQLTKETEQRFGSEPTDLMWWQGVVGLLTHYFEHTPDHDSTSQPEAEELIEQMYRLNQAITKFLEKVQ